MRAASRAAALAWVAAIASGQQPAFEAASIRVVKLASHPVFGNRGGPGTSDPGRIHLCCVGMFALLMRAYGMELDQISGPSWIMDNMGPDLYQVDATMPADTTPAQFQLMMRNLLADRFHLQVHKIKRSFPGYELVVGEGGPKLKEPAPDSAAVDPEPPATGTPRRREDGTLVLPAGPQLVTRLGGRMIVVQAQEKPISDLVKILGRLVADGLGENPNDFETPKPRVIDRTGLTGKYDFTLRFACDGCQFAAVNGAMPAPSNATEPSSAAPNVFVAVRDQLGLKLVKTKDVSLDVVVVDHVDKTPAAN